MRDRSLALRGPAFALLLLGAAAIVSAQGTLDLRLPPERRSPAEASCRMCGEIRSIREVQTEPPVPVSPNTQRGTVNPSWAVVGAAIYMPTGTGTSQSPHIGAVGTPEMVERFGSSTYEITIRMDSGDNQVVRRRDGALFRVGDLVVVGDGRLQKR